MAKLYIQDLYAISLKLHQLLVLGKVHYAKTEFEFEIIWRDALKEMQHIIINKDFDIHGTYTDLLTMIDWTYTHKPMHHGDGP